MLLEPLQLMFAKTPNHSIQSILHGLLLPTPFKRLASDDAQKREAVTPEEILKPGALYSDCSMVQVNLRNRIELPKSDAKKPEPKRDGKQPEGPEIQVVDDGECGGEAMRRLV